MAGARNTSPASSSLLGRQEGREGVPWRARSSLFSNQKLFFRMTLAVSLVLALESFTFSAAQPLPSMPAPPPSVPANMPVGVSSLPPMSASSFAVASSPVLPVESAGSPGGVVPTSETPPYPVCPLTNLPPHRPTRVQARCLAASNWSCCDDCAELTLALTTKSKNLSDLLAALAPNASSVCDLLGPHPKCQHHLEAIICAINCNPDAASYMTVSGEAKTIKFCNETAEDMFVSCRNINPLLASFTASTFLNVLFQYMGPYLGINGTLNTTVVMTPECYGTPSHTNFPATSLCCDPLVIPPECKDNITDPNLIAASNATVGGECLIMHMQSAQEDSAPDSGVQSSSPAQNLKNSAGRNQAGPGGYLLAILLSLWWFMSF